MWLVSALTTCLTSALKKEITGGRRKETKVTSILLKIAACVSMRKANKILINITSTDEFTSLP